MSEPSPHPRDPAPDPASVGEAPAPTPVTAPVTTPAPSPVPAPPTGKRVGLVTAICTPMWLVYGAVALLVALTLVLSLLHINALLGVLAALVALGLAQWLVVPRCPLPPLTVETVADREQEWAYRAWRSRWGSHVSWGNRANFTAAFERMAAEFEGGGGETVA